MAYCEEHTEKCEATTEAMQSAKSAHHRLDGMDEELGDHRRRIVELEKTDVKLAERVDNVCVRLDQLIKAIWGLLAFGGSTLVGLLIWMIQQWLTKTP